MQNQPIRKSCVLFFSVCAACLTGIANSQTRDRLSSRFLNSRFESYDKDGDGKITADESPRPRLVKRFDRNNDGSLSATEFRALMERIVERSASDSTSQAWKPSAFASEIPSDAPISKASVLAAAKYSAQYKGISFLVQYDGKLVYADYPNGGAADRAHELASGTKSFTGVLAAVALDDGVIESLDELVSDTIVEWKDDPQKSLINVRHLLDLTSGIEPGSSDGGQVPSYSSAITNKSISDAGEKFNYGPAHFQCFGEFLRRKLKAGGSSESPLQYLDRSVFQPIGLKHGRWRQDADGNAHLPSGASLKATEWAKFGELVRLGGAWNTKTVVSKIRLDECFQGSDANPAYGLTFWLNQPVSAAKRRSIRQLQFATEDFSDDPKVPSDMVFAAGAGKQRLFISRDAKLVVVRQAEGILDSLGGKRGGYKDDEFLDRLMK